MLKITFKKTRVFNEESGKIVWLPGGTFRFENSLKAISLWEQEYKRPYLKKNDRRTYDECMYYFYCMCLDDNFDIGYLYGNPTLAKKLDEYTFKEPTATTIQQTEDGNSMQLTSELIYAFMTIAGIPDTCETWNLTNLFMRLACIAELRNQENKPKKTDEELLMEYDEQNTRLRKEFGME